jgi:hypothetical protein
MTPSNRNAGSTFITTHDNRVILDESVPNSFSYENLKKASKDSWDSTMKLTTALGAGSVAFGKARDSLVGFNNAMFSASRSYQMFGKDLGDVNKIFDGISKKDFKKSYYPVCKELNRDNFVGKFIFLCIKFQIHCDIIRRHGDPSIQTKIQFV